MIKDTILKIGILMDFKRIKSVPYYTIKSSYIKILRNLVGGDKIDIRIISYEDIIENIDFDGIILIGGGKFDESQSGSVSLKSGNLERYNFEKNLIKFCFNNKIPILAICRGYQMINEIFEGEIDYISRETIYNHNSKNTQHIVNIVKGSFLSEIFDTNSLTTNSYHLKEIKVISPLFKIAAISEDNIIESIESNFEPKFYGVQWHPEISNETNMIPLYNYFVDKCNFYKHN